MSEKPADTPFDVPGLMGVSTPDAAERLQLALDAGAIIGTWVWHIPSDQIWADERFARAFGLSPLECAQGLSLQQVTASIHPDDLHRVNSGVEEALSRLGAYRCEYRVLHRDGIYRWVEANGRVETDAQGQPLRFPGILIDIESRRSAEADRDRVTELLHTFSAAIPGVVYAKDLQGRMLVANQGTTALIGKPAEFYLGKTDLEFLDDPEQARAIMATDRRIMDSGIAEQVEEEVTLPDGSVATWLSVKAPLINEVGERVGLIGSSMDVTLRKQAEAAVKELNQTLEQRIVTAIREREVVEEALRQSQKMEAVGQLTGGIAHDFNNLLAGISGSLELAKMRMGQGRVEDVERYLTVAQGAVQRAAALTHRLLAFSRRQALAPQLTDVNALIDGMEELVRRSVGPAIDLQVHAAPDLWATLIDPAQLENALLNLCINARDAMPEGGRISIATCNEWVEPCGGGEDDLTPGEYVGIRVTDTGTGMSCEVVAKAFEPFFTTKPVGAGSGLGLSMIYGFARQSGGQVRIVSAPGAGTCVCLHLPRHAASLQPAAPLGADFAPPLDGQGETVLVVDDEASVRMLVVEVLEGMGYRTLEAADSQSGLRALQSDARIDLLITDLGLPGGMNGRQMAEAGRVGRTSLPVLFITGYAETSVLDQCHLQPRTQVLTKPFSLQDLAARISTLITTR
ncbi:ATP-binding protein [Pseudomonas sp. nanlin1]|uniref:hybrid sensor histidine kinase/response regulator n=1 Tax=Pseudomonas sp. nanlin1 TaxID=3040605 RepID=UPI00388DD866